MKGGRFPQEAWGLAAGRRCPHWDQWRQTVLRFRSPSPESLCWLLQPMVISLVHPLAPSFLQMEGPRSSVHFLMNTLLVIDRISAKDRIFALAAGKLTAGLWAISEKSSGRSGRCASALPLALLSSLLFFLCSCFLFFSLYCSPQPQTLLEGGGV